jgi:TolB-like protein/Tfp pilus assembly protein PilF
MPSASSSDVKVEIGHVLFIDIVGYSKLNIHEQSEQIQRLKEIIRGTEQFRIAEAESKLLRLPTGDGAALVFRNSTEAPVICAMEIARALRDYPDLRLRMGIHSGPVNEIADLNEQANIAGAGINIAQRVMDCGDAGHILVSKRVADDLEQYPQWRTYLHNLGECEVKHGVRIGVFNFYTDQIGNEKPPRKLQALKTRRTEMRWAAATTILIALAAIIGLIIKFSRARPGPPEKSIAVLPFENLSRDPDNAYFADGIQEEILTRLSKMGDLKVISRTSTQRYKSAPENLSEIAKQLGVAHILEGTVQKAADQARVNVQLIDARNDSHLWADKFDRKLTDIFSVESEIAAKIAETLQAKLSAGEEQQLGVIPTKNPAAYDAYLRGLAFEARASLSASNFKDVARCFREAVDLDPAFALAWARLAMVNCRTYWFRFDRSPQRITDAQQALDQAVKLQPDLGEVYLARGVAATYLTPNFERALEFYHAALQRLPNSAAVIAAIAYTERRQGRWKEALEAQERAAQIDPRNPQLLLQWCGTYFCLRDFAALHSLLDRALDITPDDTTLISTKAAAYQAQGDLVKARKVLSSIPLQPGNATVFSVQMLQLIYERNYAAAIAGLQPALVKPDPAVGTNFPDYFILLGLAQARSGDVAGAHETFMRAKDFFESLRKNGDNTTYLAADLGLVYANLGDKFAALREYQRAVVEVGSDAMFGPGVEEILAKIDVQLKDTESAISALSRVLKEPYFSWLYRSAITPALLREDPVWDPLRKDPRFQKLCEEKAK